MASEEAASEPLQYKTWVLKVSIDCEGCKKKVKRILQKIDGVYTIDVDAPQNKVTVTGNVDAETVIRKLIKSKKHAELWPEKKPTNPNPSSKNKSKNQKQSKESSKSKDESSDDKPSPSDDASATADGNKAEEATGGKPAEASKASSKSANKEPPKSDEKNAGESSNSAPDKAADPANGENATGDGGKKKGKKAQKENSNNNGGGGGESVAKEAGGNSSGTAGGTSSSPPPPPPQQYMYHYPVYPHQPAYMMSYNMAHPSASQAYYATAMPPVSQGHTYSPYPPPPEYYYGPWEPSSSMPPPPPPPRYDNMFSDENPNACNLM